MATSSERFIAYFSSLNNINAVLCVCEPEYVLCIALNLNAKEYEYTEYLPSTLSKGGAEDWYHFSLSSK